MEKILTKGLICKHLQGAECAGYLAIILPALLSQPQILKFQDSVLKYLTLWWEKGPVQGE